MNDFIKTLIARRSIRAYLPEQVREEDLAQILEAGTYAACGKGAQSGKIVVVQDKPTLTLLERLNAAAMGKPDAKPFYGAPMVCVVLADTSIPTYLEDGSLIMGNLMAAAHSLGVGSCWIHRAKKVFATDEGKALLKKCGISENYAAVAHCILGYPAQDPEAKPRKADFIVRV